MSDKQLKPAVVLVADRTLSARYKILFEGIFATMQTTQVPELAMRHFVSPAARTDSSGRALTAPLGLRRVESALLKFTDLKADDVVCTTPEALPRLLGPWTKIVAVSSSDPLGMGMSNTTTANFWSGELYTRSWTRKMFAQILEAKKKYNFKVVAGGAGAWQLARCEDPTAAECIDIIFEGFFESAGPQLFTDLLNDRPTERFINTTDTAAHLAQPISAPSMLGIIELSRGCGRGCRFCTMARKQMAHLDPETIIADLRTNVAGGITSVVSGSEDFFRYGSANTKPDFSKLCNLLEKMRRVPGLSFMQIDHANVTSVLQLTDAELREIRRLLTWQKKTDYLWVNMGAESANGSLVARSCPGKIAPFDPDNWEQMILETADKMTRTGFFSVFSLVLGLPGETPDDITRTLALIKRLEKTDAVIFPVFYEPLAPGETRFTLDSMTADHLELYRTCYEINFRKVPLLFWDNQRAGGVSFTKRALMRLLGKTEIHSWRKAFAELGRKLNSHRSGINDAPRHTEPAYEAAAG